MPSHHHTLNRTSVAPVIRMRNHAPVLHSAPESLTYEIWKAAVKNGSIHPEYGQGWVRLQWDPDHSPRPPYGHYQRRAIQLGLRGGFQKRLADGSGVLAILDVSPVCMLPAPLTGVLCRLRSAAFVQRCRKPQHHHFRTISCIIRRDSIVTDCTAAT